MIPEINLRKNIILYLYKLQFLLCMCYTVCLISYVLVTTVHTVHFQQPIPEIRSQSKKYKFCPK